MQINNICYTSNILIPNDYSTLSELLRINVSSGKRK